VNISDLEAVQNVNTASEIVTHSVADLGEGQGGRPWLGKWDPLGPLE